MVPSDLFEDFGTNFERVALGETSHDVTLQSLHNCYSFHDPVAGFTRKR